jgi:protein-S-isoprenylcysteine O-methyltransferase Ste14
LENHSPAVVSEILEGFAVNLCAFLIVLLNYAYLGLLPLVFFKRNGRANFFWWLTTCPFIFSLVTITLCTLGFYPPASGYNTVSTNVLALLAVLFSFTSIVLISCAVGSHSVPVALWHQQNDAPVHIVTWGAYRRIRHPLYASYILMLSAGFVFCPDPCTAAALLIGSLILNFTAAREEAKLSASQFGSEYQDYMRQTGRFLPKLSVKN